jgi:hypothetical protein
LQTKPVSRRPVLIWLIVSQVLALASLVFWLVVAGLSVMAFDAGVTQEAWNFVIAVWSYLILPIGFAIAAWIAYSPAGLAEAKRSSLTLRDLLLRLQDMRQDGCAGAANVLSHPNLRPVHLGCAALAP